MHVEPSEPADLRHRRRSVLSGALRNPLGLASAGWIVLVVLAAVAAPLLTRQGPLDQDLSTVLAGPSSHHLLGTDDLGRDVFSRLLYGARITLLGVAEAVAVWLVLGLALGLVAGYLGGRIDRVVMRITELVLAFPLIIILLVVLSVFANNLHISMVVFGGIASAGLVRLVRGSTLAVKEETYIVAAQVAGLSRLRIVFRHILPRLTGMLIVQASVFAGVALVTETGLAFLGFGPQPPAPSWGGLIADAASVLQRQPWLLVPPTVAIALTVIAFALLGDALRDSRAEPWSRSMLKPEAALSRPVVSPLPLVASGAATETDILLAVEQLSVAFPNAGELVPAVEDVSFEVRRGETVGIVGESGSGKTVTALSVLNLVPGSGVITAGSCKFEGRDLLAMGGEELAAIRGRGIAFITQDPMVGLDPNFTVGSLLAEAVRHHQGGTRTAARQGAVELLELVNLFDAPAVARRYPFQLSGGMAQRVAIALALAGEPKLLIADEPTTALDVTVQAEVLALLARLQEETGMAVLIITHDWGVVATVCRRAITMYAGQIVEQGDVVAMFDRPLHPYTRGLLAANPHLAVKGRPLTVIPGVVPTAGEWPDGCHFFARCASATDECAARPIELLTLNEERLCRCIHADTPAATAVRAR